MRRPVRLPPSGLSLVLLLHSAAGLAVLGAARNVLGGQTSAAPKLPPVCSPCIRGEMSYLASDELRGRGSATRDEGLAALYAASLFEGFGLEPGGAPGGGPDRADGIVFDGFIQRVPLPNPLPAYAVTELRGFEAAPRNQTSNVVGILPGADPKLRSQIVLITAHLDHLGVGPAIHGDSIYNGADDDASGTTAVIELARMLSRAKRPRRTVAFVLFGSEELGGLGSRYFFDHPPFALDKIVANLEFEMIGRPDPLARASLWLSGYRRSDLGAALVRHGAPLIPDPHPEQYFFRRSDNYDLARRGVVAQTISSFGLHRDYHQPSDDLSRIDFPHLDFAIAAMEPPIAWLANTDWSPKWTLGGRP